MANVTLTPTGKDQTMATTKRTRTTTTTCECADRLCPASHNGHSQCTLPAVTTVFRVDMIDRTGTRMCDRCADDSMDSGLFSQRRA